MRRLLAAAVCLLAACTLGRADAAPRIAVGVGSTTEQRVLAAITVLALDRAGMEPELRGDLGGTVGLRRAALAGTIDVYWDYTGAAWGLGMGQQAPPADPVDSFERVRRADEENGLTWLTPSRANATLALFVDAEALPPPDQPRGMGWLAGELSAGERALCADPDFLRRRGGMDALGDAYSIDLGRLSTVGLREGAAIRAAASGRCFAALATATSGVARNAGLAPVADELDVFPAFVVGPVAREQRLAQVPDLAAVVEGVAALIDTETLATMSARAEAGEDPADVAEDVLAAARPRGRQ